MSVRVYSETDGEVPFLALTLKESFELHYSMSELITSVRITSSFISIDYAGNVLQFYIDGIMSAEDNIFTYRLIPLRVSELLNYQFPETRDTKTFEAIMNKVGINVESEFNTEAVYWDIPRCKLYTLLNLVQDNILITTGGGSLITFTSNGKLRLLDLKSICNSEPSKKIVFEKEHINVDLSWRLLVPGTIRHIKYSVKGNTSELIIFQDGFGLAEIREFVTIDAHSGSALRAARNVFYRNFYSSLIVRGRMDVPVPIALGEFVEDLMGNRYVVFEVQVVLQGEKADIRLVLVNRP